MAIKNIIFAAAFIGSCNQIKAIDTSTTFSSKDNSKGMHYLEYHLITKSKDQKNVEDTHFGATAALATAIYAGTLVKTTDLSEIKQTDIIKVGFAAGIVTALYYKIITCFRLRTIYTNNLLIFVKNWAHHKNYTAQQFHALFDSLAELLKIKGESAVKNYSTEIIDLLMYHLSHEFESRYKSESESMADTLKVATDIAKNINDFNG